MELFVKYITHLPAKRKKELFSELFEKSEQPVYQPDQQITGQVFASTTNSSKDLMSKITPPPSKALLRHNLGQMAANRYTTICNDIEHKFTPVDESLAIILRIFDKYPNLFLSYPTADVQQLLDTTALSRRELSIYLGRDQVSVSRYMKEEGVNKKPSGTTEMLMFLMRMFVLGGRFKDYVAIVNEEAKSRGIDNLQKQGWMTKEQQFLNFVKRQRTAVTDKLKKLGLETYDWLEKVVELGGELDPIGSTRKRKRNKSLSEEVNEYMENIVEAKLAIKALLERNVKASQTAMLKTKLIELKNLTQMISKREERVNRINTFLEKYYEHLEIVDKVKVARSSVKSKERMAKRAGGAFQKQYEIALKDLQEQESLLAQNTEDKSMLYKEYVLPDAPDADREKWPTHH